VDSWILKGGGKWGRTVEGIYREGEIVDPSPAPTAAGVGRGARPRAMRWKTTLGSMYHSASGEITWCARSRVLQEAPRLHPRWNQP
jgi:hypothetical protein